MDESENEPEALARALFLAVGARGSIDEAHRLLDAGAQATFRQRGAGGWTTRMQAFSECIDILPRLRGHPYVHWFDAVIDGDVDAVRASLRDGASVADVDVYGLYDAMRYAACLGYVEIVRTLLAGGADPDRFESAAWRHPLVEALAAGQLATADVLWAAGSRVPRLLWHVVWARAPRPALSWALAAEPEADLGEALHQGTHYGYEAGVFWLLEVGADPDARKFGETPLMTAAFYRREEIAQRLLEAGADPHATDHRGRTALHYAISREHIHDPDEPFDYDDAALQRPIARRLRALGVPVPPRDPEAAT